MKYFKVGNSPDSDFPSNDKTVVLDSDRVMESDYAIAEEQTPEVVHAFKDYEILEEVARGGMGVVYRAHDRELDRNVAIKAMLSAHITNAESVLRFSNESRLMGYLRHPGIPDIYACGVCEDGRPYFAMRFVEGRTLQTILDSYDCVANRGQLLNWFTTLCQTLAYTHASGVVHLDVKPSNIMVGGYGDVCLFDWGLASFFGGWSYEPSVTKQGEAALQGQVALEDEVALWENNAEEHSNGSIALVEARFRQCEKRIGGILSQGGRVHGTPRYMSPEQANGEPVGPEADVFSLGAILLEILTGKATYYGDSWKVVFKKARNADLTDAFKCLDDSSADPRLIRLTRKCLQPIAQDRPESAEVLVHELNDYHDATLARATNDMDRFFELSLDLFCIAGLDGYLRRVNPNFSRMLGYSEAELLSRPMVDFVHEADRASTIEQFSNLKEGRQVERFRNRWRAADGSYFDFEWSAKSIPEEQLIFAVARNLTV